LWVEGVEVGHGCAVGPQDHVHRGERCGLRDGAGVRKRAEGVEGSRERGPAAGLRF